MRTILFKKFKALESQGYVSIINGKRHGLFYDNKTNSTVLESFRVLIVGDNLPYGTFQGEIINKKDGGKNGRTKNSL